MANDLNQVVLIGNCVRDVAISYTQGGMCIGKLSLASNRSVKQNGQWVSEVSYFDVTIFGKTAENLQPYLLKGQKIAVSGILKQDRWEKDGHKFSKIGIIANVVQLIGSNSGSNRENKPSESVSSPNPINNSAMAENPSVDDSTGFEEFPEDIPF
jgi:single-strand DNA-binding protein